MDEDSGIPPMAVSRWLKGVRQSSLVFWKGLVTLSTMRATDVSSCRVSSLSPRKAVFDCSARDKEETWQKETSERRSEAQAYIRPLRNNMPFGSILAINSFAQNCRTFRCPDGLFHSENVFPDLQVSFARPCEHFWDHPQISGLWASLRIVKK